MHNRVEQSMNQEIYETLCDICGAEFVFVQEPMSRHTTFRTGGPADVLVTPKAEQISRILDACRKAGQPWTVIGNGSNLLVGDGGIRGVVLEIGRQIAEIEIDGTSITAGAGAMLSSIASKAAQAALTGMEFASGIPGSLGGAVVMNAGAYGGEMKDILKEVTVLTPEGELQTLSVEELDLSYRHSIVPERGYLVIQAVLELQPGKPEEIQAIMDDLKEKRVSKQPLEYPSAGSTFKRPEGYFAGKLIQDAGLRGFQVGGAQVSEKHCGFVINRDHATSADICNLMDQVSGIVFEKSGVRLEPEVKKIGDF